MNGRTMRWLALTGVLVLLAAAPAQAGWNYFVTSYGKR